METLAFAFSGPFSVSAESNGSWQKRVVDMSPISGQKEIQKPLFRLPCVLCFTYFKVYHYSCKFHRSKRKAVRDKVYIPTLDPTNTKYSDIY